MQRSKAFTLIELLVVISVIAILLAIMLPALGKAKNLAQGAACKGNLKNYCLAVSMYTDDSDGRFPYPERCYFSQTAAYPVEAGLSSYIHVRWANGDRADPVNVVVDAHVNVLDSASGDMAGPRILHESDGTFDGSLGKGETAVVDYSATLDEPGFGCPAVCGGEVVLQLLYGIEIEAEGTPPVPDTEVRSVPFTFDCG